MRFSIVTPSYNQVQYLPDTLESVLGQTYPDVEYLVYDGGSTDGSAAVLEQYADRIDYWQSQPDGGQAAAINAGFERATGDVLGWINSDDYYLPGTLATVAERLRGETAPTIVFGNAICLRPARHDCWSTDVVRDHATHAIDWMDYIAQPSSFWNRAAWEATGRLNASMNWIFDWEWYIRAKRAGTRFVPIDDYLSLYRIHPAHKTGTGGSKRHIEITKLYEQYLGPEVAEIYQRLIRVGGVPQQAHRLLSLSRLSRIVQTARVLYPTLGRTLDYTDFRGLVLTAYS